MKITPGKMATAIQMFREGPEGWSISSADPMALLEAFDSLHMGDLAHELRALQQGVQQVRVVFHTYTDIGQERIDRNEGVYPSGSFAFESRRATIAFGPGFKVY